MVCSMFVSFADFLRKLRKPLFVFILPIHDRLNPNVQGKGPRFSAVPAERSGANLTEGLGALFAIGFVGLNDNLAEGNAFIAYVYARARNK